MSIVAAAVVPHSPLLLASVAKEHGALLKATTTQLQMLSQECYAAQPDVLVLLTPHGPSFEDSIVVHAAEKYRGDFTEFGDMETRIEAHGAIGFTHQLKMAAEREHQPLRLQTFDTLDYGTSVPLTFFWPALRHVPIVPIIVPHQHPELLQQFGHVLHDFLNSSRERTIVIASADLTRRKDKQPDLQRRPTHEERQLSSAITAVDPVQIMALQPQASTCGYGPIVTLVCALHGLAPRGTITSFEAPFGVGLMTATFSFGT